MLSEKISNFSVYRLEARYWISYLFVFLLIALTQFPFMHYHVSFADNGYHLTNQDLANHLGLKYIEIVPFWWLSDVIGGWWLTITESYGFWGARLGGVIALGLTGIITANTLFQIYKPSVGIVCAIVLAGFCLPYDILNYYTVPTLLYAFFSWFFLKLHFEPTRFLYAGLSGIFFVLLVFSRMPLVTVFVVPTFCLLACYYFDRKQFRPLLYSYSRMGGVIFISFALFAGYLHSQDLLKSYYSFQLPAPNYSVFNLLSLMGKQMFPKLPYFLFLTCLAYGLYILIKNGSLSGRSARRMIAAFFLFSIILIVLYLQFPIVKEIKIKMFQFIWPDNFDVFPVLVLLNIVCFCLLKNEIAFEEIVLFILAASWPILRCMGSACGLILGITVGFLLCGLSLVMLIRVGNVYKCKMPIFCICALFGLILGGKALKLVVNPKKTANYHLSRLEGIYSTPEHAKDFKLLIQKIESYVKRGDRIFAGPHIPLIHYASRTFPIGDETLIFFLGDENLSKKLDQIVEMPPPKIIVRPKYDFTNPKSLLEKFDLSMDPQCVVELERKVAIIDQKVAKWNPQLIYSNDYYELFTPEK